MKRVLKLSNALVKIMWTEGEGKLCVVSTVNWIVVWRRGYWGRIVSAFMAVSYGIYQICMCKACKIT